MRLLTIAALTLTLASTMAHADKLVEATHGTARLTANVLGATTAPAVLPFFFSSLACESGSTVDTGNCLARVSAAVYSVTTTTSVLLKEDVKNVEVDSYNFLAGEPKTLALEEVIEKVREADENAELLSDEEVVAAMLNAL